MFSRNELEGQKVAMLLGGRSAEREVSLNSGEACASALESRGFDVERVDVDLDIADRLHALQPAVAFVALHGRYGEDGCIQGLLESMGIPYTGAGVLASALAMDKVASKHLFASVGIPTPEYLVVSREEAADFCAEQVTFGFPCIVKPSAEGSSVGVSIVKEEVGLSAAIERAAGFGKNLLIERYVRGREVAVAVLDHQALGAIEIVPERPFYDYEAKYAKGSGTRYLFPAPLETKQYERVCEVAAQAHRVLGCRGVTRSDFMVAGSGDVWLLELNTLPGMTATSLVPKIAAGKDIDFGELCERLLASASLET